MGIDPEIWIMQAFAEKYKLPFTLLSDEGNKVRKEWGVPSDLFGALPGRQTYVLDKNGVCRLIYNNQFQPEKHIDETLKFLKSAWKLKPTPIQLFHIFPTSFLVEFMLPSKYFSREYDVELCYIYQKRNNAFFLSSCLHIV